MPKPQNNFAEMAKDMAERLDRQRAMGQQLALLPDEGGEGSAKAVRGQGKALNQMRAWLASKGMRLPEDVLAEMAGLTTREDAMLAAMADTERLLLWMFDGAVVPKGGVRAPTASMRGEMFKYLYATKLRAAEALLPYGLAKITADVQVTQAVQIVMPAAQGAPRGPDMARDVTPQARRMGPPPMPTQTQQNQQVSDADFPASDATSRTE